MQPEALTELPVIAADEIVSRHYLRVTLVDGETAASFVVALQQQGIGVAAQLDPNTAKSSDAGQLAVITGPIRERQMQAALAALQAARPFAPPIARLRVEDLPPA